MLPILAFTSNADVLNRMALYWGVTPLLIDPVDTTDALIEEIERYMLEHASVMPGDVVAVCAGSPPGTTSNMLKLHTIVGRGVSLVGVGAAEDDLDASE